MKENKLSIIINKPIHEVFAFTLDPANTSKWISEIEVEETSEWPVKIGTIYRNKSRIGIWNQYKLVELIENHSFTLRSNTDENFSVRYSFTELSEGSTVFEYFEWTEYTNISDPFKLDSLKVLKSILETQD